MANVSQVLMIGRQSSRKTLVYVMTDDSIPGVSCFACAIKRAFGIGAVSIIVTVMSKMCIIIRNTIRNAFIDIDTADSIP